MKKHISIALFLSFVLAQAGYAQEHVKLDSLIAAAKQNNASIIAARKRWDAMRARATQARTWDKPRLTVEYWSIPEGTFDAQAAPEKMYGISQMIPFPGKLSIKGKAADSAADAMKWEYRGTELKVLSDLKMAYGAYYYINRSIETYRQTVELMKTFAKVAESRYVVGRSMQSDVLRAQVETEKMAAMLVTLEQEKQTSRVEINRLAGRNADTLVGDPQEPAPRYITAGWDEIKAAAVKNNPEIGMSKANISKSAWEKRMALMEYLPDFDLALRRKTMNDAWAGTDIMVGVDIPLWFWKQSSGVIEMSAELKAAEAEHKDAELMTVAKAKEAFTKLEATKRLLELYDTSVIPKSEQSLKVAQSAFSAGRLSFMELLDTVRSCLEFKLEYYNYVSEYQKNIVALERIVGMELLNEN